MEDLVQEGTEVVSLIRSVRDNFFELESAFPYAIWRNWSPLPWKIGKKSLWGLSTVGQ